MTLCLDTASAEQVDTWLGIEHCEALAHLLAMGNDSLLDDRCGGTVRDGNEVDVINRMEGLQGVDIVGVT